MATSVRATGGANRSSSFLRSLHQNKTTIGNSSVIGVGTTIGRITTIGNYVKVGSNASIGDWVRIDDFAEIGNEVTVSDEVAIHRKAGIGKGVHLGEGVVVAAYASVAAHAFIPRDTVLKSTVYCLYEDKRHRLYANEQYFFHGHHRVLIGDIDRIQRSVELPTAAFSAACQWLTFQERQ